jgi:hypothetical protein
LQRDTAALFRHLAQLMQDWDWPKSIHKTRRKENYFSAMKKSPAAAGEALARMKYPRQTPR